MNKSRLGLAAIRFGSTKLALAALLVVPVAPPALGEPGPADFTAAPDAIEMEDGVSWRPAGQALVGGARPTARGPSRIDPARLAAELAGKDGKEARAAFGTRFENGLELALSATHMANDRTHAFSYGVGNTARIARAFDYDHSTKIHGKAGFGAFKLTATHSELNKGVLGTHFGALFDDPTNSWFDKNTLIDLAHSTHLRQFGLTTRVFRGSYGFRGDQLYPAELYVDTAESHWWGTEVKAAGNVFARHRLSLAADYQRNDREANRPTGVDPSASQQVRESQAMGLLVEDEYAWSPNVTLTGGVRYDYATIERSTHVSPRVGLTYTPGPQTTATLRYRHAVRNPTKYGSSYSFTALQMGSHELRAERVRSAEAAVEHQPHASLTLTSTIFSSRTDGAIRQITDAGTAAILFQNEPEFEARGAELSAEAHIVANATVRASYTRQAVDSSAGLGSAPRDVAQLTFSGPVLSDQLTAALETQYTTVRQSSLGEVGGFGLANLTLSYRMHTAPIELSASAYNILDRRYADPITGDRGTPPGYPYEQGGRTVGVKAVLWL